METLEVERGARSRWERLKDTCARKKMRLRRAARALDFVRSCRDVDVRLDDTNEELRSIEMAASRYASASLQQLVERAEGRRAQLRRVVSDETALLSCALAVCAFVERLGDAGGWVCDETADCVR